MTYSCPRCSRFSVRRSPRCGWFETRLLPLFALRPYRCRSCGWHSYRIGLTQHGRTRIQPSRVPRRVSVAVLRGVCGLLVLLAVPLLLPGSAPVLRNLRKLTEGDWSAGSPSQPVTRAKFARPPLASLDRTPLPSAAVKGGGELVLNGPRALDEMIKPGLQSPAPERKALGSLRCTGEVYVYVTDSKAPAGVIVPPGYSVFTGDTVRTGADGSAALEVAGIGIFLIYQHTEISFAGQGYFATLKQGAVSFRAAGGGGTFDVHLGGIVVAREGTEAATADIERDADGSARVRCTLGSIGVVSPAESKGTFLRLGQEAFISPDGKITLGQAKQGEGAVYQGEIKGRADAGSTRGSVKASNSSPGGGSRRTAWIVLGVGGGAAAGVAAILIGHDNGSSNFVSPSTFE